MARTLNLLISQSANGSTDEFPLLVLGAAAQLQNEGTDGPKSTVIMNGFAERYTPHDTASNIKKKDL